MPKLVTTVAAVMLLAACGGGPKMCGPSQLDGDLLPPLPPDEAQLVNRKLKEEFQQCLRGKCGEPPQGERRREWEKCSQYVSEFPLPYR